MRRHDLTHIDLVANIRFPGSRAHGIQVAAMAEALSASGLTVDVVVPRRFPAGGTDPWQHYGVSRSFAVQRLSCLDLIDLVPASWQRLPFLAQSATFGWRALARTALDGHSGVLVRDHYTLAALAWGLRAPALTRVAAEVHSLPESPGPRRRAIGLLARLPAVIAISGALRDDLVAGGVDPGAVLLARDGVHLARFADLPAAPAARAHLNLPELPTVVYAGQLYAWKGVDTLVRAVAGLPSAQLLVVGGEKEPLQRLVELARGLAPGRVHFTGSVPHAAVPFHLAAGDVIALPNSARAEISARHTSPLKLFEALASGRAIVASDLPSLREVLRDGHNAVLAAPDDPEALAAGLARLLGDEPLRRRLAAAARADAAPFDWSARGLAVARFLRERLTVGAAP
ncbi:MAG TPA: glycosyltransferase family 4 protein [Planctomycetota bacterium]|nr:glycosyltransferase family 4 protein [Planctomycetota bacterium]